MADETDLKIRITTSADTSGAKQAEAAVKGVTTATDQTSKAAKEAAKETQGLGREVSHLSRLGHEANMALDGLSKGGMAGLMQTGRGLAGIIKALATGGISAALLPAIIAVTAGIKALNYIAAQNEAAMRKMWDAASAGAAEYQAAIEKAKKDSAIKLQAMTDDVNRLVSAYNRLRDSMTSAESFAGDRAAAEKRLALAKAKTPQEEAAIEARFAAEESERKKKGLGARRGTAEGEIKNLQAKLDAAREASDKAAEAASYGRTRALRFGPDDQDATAVAIRRDAFVRAEAAKLAKEKEAKIRAEIEPQIEERRKEIRAIDREETVRKIDREVLSIVTSKKVAGEVSVSGRRAELRRQAEAGLRMGGAEGASMQDAAVIELRRMDKATRELVTVVKSSGAATADSIEAATKALKKTENKIKLNQQAGPGGGG